MRILKVFVVLIFCLSLSNMFCVSTPALGDGTSTSPYLIDNFSNLLWLSENSELWNSNLYFTQTSDIDASESAFLNNGAGFLPIGNNSTNFKGNYDGDNYSINNLYINRSEDNYVGLFGRINYSNIKNLSLYNEHITGNSYIGGLIGYSDHTSGDIRIENCYVSGDITGNDYVGGLIGYLRCGVSSNTNKYTRVSLCGTAVNVIGNSFIGGLIGESTAPMSYARISIENCYSNGSVDGQNYVGGIVGKSSSYRRRTGSSASSVMNCFSTCDIEGISNVGGIAGYIARSYVHNSYYTYYSGASIESCYSMGDVTGENYVGGIVGNAQTGFAPSNITCIKRCFTNSYITGNENVGGIAGYSQSYIQASFWNLNTTGQTISSGITSDYGVTDTEMRSQSTFTNANWNLGSVWSMNSVDNLGYPHLAWYVYPQHSDIDIPANSSDIIGVDNTDIEIQFNDGNHSVFNFVVREFTDFDDYLFELPENIVSTFNKYWSISALNYSPTNYTLWIDLSSFEDITNYNNLTVLKRDNYLSAWQKVTDLGATVSLENYKICISGLSTFSEFIIAKSDDQTLPIELSSFTANNQSGVINIFWTTETESNLLGFNLYRGISEDFSHSNRINASIINATNSSLTTNYTFTDLECETSINYYWLESCELSNENSFFGPIEIILDDNHISNPVYTCTKLHDAYPNPFNPETKIVFSVKDNEKATLNIYNIKGQLVKEYNPFSPGQHSVIWKGTDNNNSNVCSGIYFYRLDSSSYSEIKKVILMK